MLEIMMLQTWTGIADACSDTCPSQSTRDAVVALVEKVERLGPLEGPNRTRSQEFQRIYKFLTYNEPARVMAVVEERLAACAREGGNPLAKHNAWNYVVGAFDLWLNRARVVYMAGGLLEGALRARLNARMTDHFGQDWTQIEEAVPSPVRPLAAGESSTDLLRAIRRSIDDWDSSDTSSGESVANGIREILATKPSPILDGAQLVGKLQFGELRNFFQSKRHWNRGPKLETLFHDSVTDRPPLRDDVDRALEIVHGLRNDVAHYLRPIATVAGVQPVPTGSHATPVTAKPTPTFTGGLYAMARLARWMSVDLQHFYESVDTREATELALLIEDPGLLQKASPDVEACVEPTCDLTSPLILMLKRAPATSSEVKPGAGAYACLHHRVERRALRHRPLGE
jgi:hypothetical protein